ncbi:MAG: hypothetical protein AAF664_18275 [Planctomycetota bacterium]
MPTEAEQRFIDAWRFAAPRLEAIRQQELRKLDESDGLRMLGTTGDRSNPTSGLIEFQSWMMRWRVRQLLDQHETQPPAMKPSP